MQQFNGLPLNPNLVRPITTSSIAIPNFGEVVVFGNNDLDFDPQEFAGLFRNGEVRSLEKIESGAGVDDEREIVVRKFIPGTLDKPSFESVVGTARHYTQEVNVLRGLGVKVVDHTIAVIDGYSIPGSGDDRDKNRPLVVTVARLIPDQTEPGANLDIEDPANAGQITAMVQGFQTYYTHDTRRPHLTDVVSPGQYSSDVQLIDIQIDFVTDPDDEGVLGDEYNIPMNCARQLKNMYEDFELTPDEIQKLQDDHTFVPQQPQERPSITITKRPESADSDDESATKPAPPSNTPITPKYSTPEPSIAGVNTGLEQAKKKADESLKAFDRAADLADEAADIIASLGVWASSEEAEVLQTEEHWRTVATEIVDLQNKVRSGESSINTMVANQ